VGLATCAALPVGDPEDAGLVAALHARDIDVEWVVWNHADPQRLHEWIDVLIIRSTWDYTDHHADFLSWIGACSVQVFNPSELVRWNSDKRYLMELAAAGIPTVPTVVVEKTDEDWPVPQWLTDFDEFVIKPAIGAGSKGARRFAQADKAEAREHAAGLLASGSTALFQPYLPSVDAGSETALIFLDGAFSHSITKGPLLRTDGQAQLVDGLYVAESIDSRTASQAQLDVAQRVLGALPSDDWLYARVDLIDDVNGAPILLELEMVEPSLFFACDPPAADRLVAGIERRLEGETPRMRS